MEIHKQIQCSPSVPRHKSIYCTMRVHLPGMKESIDDLYGSFLSLLPFLGTLFDRWRSDSERVWGRSAPTGPLHGLCLWLCHALRY
jgi:hypothetical protein